MAYDKLTDQRLGETSEKVRARVEKAREKQRLRFVNTDLACNAYMRPADVRAYCKLDDASTSLMRTAMSQLQMIVNIHLIPTYLVDHYHRPCWFEGVQQAPQAAFLRLHWQSSNFGHTGSQLANDSDIVLVNHG